MKKPTPMSPKKGGGHMMPMPKAMPPKKMPMKGK